MANSTGGGVSRVSTKPKLQHLLRYWLLVSGYCILLKVKDTTVQSSCILFMKDVILNPKVISKVNLLFCQGKFSHRIACSHKHLSLCNRWVRQVVDVEIFECNVHLTSWCPAGRCSRLCMELVSQEMGVVSSTVPARSFSTCNFTLLAGLCNHLARRTVRPYICQELCTRHPNGQILL